MVSPETVLGLVIRLRNGRCGPVGWLWPGGRYRYGGGAEAGCLCAGVGCRVAGGVLDSGEEDAGGLAGGVEFAAGGGFVEEVAGLVACGFGEDGGQGGPVGVGQDAGGVLGDAVPDVGGEGHGGGLVVGDLEMLDGLGAAAVCWAWPRASCQRPARTAAHRRAASRVAAALPSLPLPAWMRSRAAARRSAAAACSARVWERWAQANIFVAARSSVRSSSGAAWAVASMSSPRAAI